MYCYDISTDGSGKNPGPKSNWTDEINLTAHNGLYPKLLLSCDNIPIEVGMTVYRKVAKRAEDPFGDESTATQFTNQGDKEWTDEDTEPAGH